MWSPLLFKKLKTGCCAGGLEYLNIRGNSITDWARQLLAQALLSNSNSKITWMTDDKFDLREGVHSLDLASSAVTDAEAKLLVGVVRNNKEVTSMNLLRNQISFSSAKELVDILKSHVTLKTLCGISPNETSVHITGKQHTPADATLLGWDLKANGNIRDLQITNTAFGDGGTASIASALNRSGLTSLKLTSNGIGDAGAMAIAQNLLHNGITTLACCTLVEWLSARVCRYTDFS